MIDLSKAQSFSEGLAIKLGKHILASRNRIHIVEQKDIVDICTNIDKEVEQMAIETISDKYPDHNIHSEECGFIDKKSEYTWYLDPIDGTKEFLRGIPNYQTCITLESRDSILVGVVFQPANNSLYSATVDSNTKKNNKIVSVNSMRSLEKSIIYAHLPPKAIPEQLYWQAWSCLGKLNRACYRIRAGSDNAIYLSWVASGSSEALLNFYTDYSTKWEDVSAGLLFVQQSGGKVTDMEGKLIKNRDLSKGIVASNGHIHDQLLEIIQRSIDSRT